MKLAIIIIGDEILLGQVTDTNSGAIARALGPDGWQTVSVETTGDDAADIEGAISRALSRADLIITTGGLGPTKDDITKSVLCRIFGGTLREDPEVALNVRRVFERRHLKMNALTATQAMVPTSCSVIQNLYGTAPIMCFERDGKMLVAMPGVPFETEGMLPEVCRLIHSRFSPDTTLLHSTVVVTGITESDLAARLAEFEETAGEGIHLAYLPVPGLIRLRLDGSGDTGSDIESRYDAAFERLVRALDGLDFHNGDDSPAAIVLEKCRARGLTLATAESCTGGNIARSITGIAGCSDVYRGGVVSYANEVKSGLLGVVPAAIEREGAVSRTVVEQMAAGACRATGARCAVATSGIAGPGGGTPDKPVGTVWIAWAVDGEIFSHMFSLPGNRDRVIGRATAEALLGLAKLL